MHCDIESDRGMIAAVANVSANARPARRPWLPLLSAVLHLAQGKAELQRHSEHAWSSVTFAGTRHSIVLSFSGVDAVLAGEAFIAALPDHEFTIPRQLVADAAVVRVEHDLLQGPRMVIEAELLLLEES